MSRARARDRAVPQAKGLTWEKSEPSLEDVFIDLMARAKDNFQ